MPHFLELSDLGTDGLERVLDLAEIQMPEPVLHRQGVALLFQKPSTRTRNSMEVAVAQLGGHPVYIRPEEVGLDERETAEDVARTLMGYHSIIAARVFEHSLLERMAAVSDVPVVNLLSDDAHPIQVLADFLTIRQEFGRLAGCRLAYVGDANNMARSLALGASMVGMELTVAHPEGYDFDDSAVARLEAAGALPAMTTDPAAAIEGADVVYTDAWFSMGQEAEARQRRADFGGFTIDRTLMGAAADTAIFLHCLPAHRGDEATDEVLDGPQSRIFRQAHNRLHSARGLLAHLVGSDG